MKYLDDFYIRVPFNSMDYYNSNLKYCNLKDNFGSLLPCIKENKELLLNTSEELFRSLKVSKLNDNKINMPCLKYLIRSSTRSTPYGLLSGVGLGEFSEEQNSNIGEFSKKTRVDLEWLHNVIKIYESNIGETIKLCLNNSLIYSNDRIIKIWSTFFSEELDDIDIKNTKVVKELLNICPYGVFKTKNEIIKNLEIIFVNSDKKTINSFLDEL